MKRRRVGDLAARSARISSVRWGDGRAVEGARLLSVYRGNAPIEGSNPSLSAPNEVSARTIDAGCWVAAGRLYCHALRAPVAQGIERWVADPKAAGSNPARRTTAALNEGGFFAPSDLRRTVDDLDSSPDRMPPAAVQSRAERCPSGLRCCSRKAVW